MGEGGATGPRLLSSQLELQYCGCRHEAVSTAEQDGGECRALFFTDRQVLSAWAMEGDLHIEVEGERSGCGDEFLRLEEPREGDGLQTSCCDVGGVGSVARLGLP